MENSGRANHEANTRRNEWNMMNVRQLRCLPRELFSLHRWRWTFRWTASARCWTFDDMATRDLLLLCRWDLRLKNEIYYRLDSVWLKLWLTLNRNLCDVIRCREPHIVLDFDLCFAGIVVWVARKLQKREWNLSWFLLSVVFVWVLMLKMLVELVLRRESLATAVNRTREESPLSVSLNVSLELRFIVEESRAEVASVLAARCNLHLDRDAMRAKMVIELRHRMELLRALTAHVLLDLVVRLHVIVEVRDLSKGSAAVHLDADEWSLAGMESSVIVEICDLRESFATVNAKKKFDYSRAEIELWRLWLTRRMADRSCGFSRDCGDWLVERILSGNSCRCTSCRLNGFWCDWGAKSFGWRFSDKAGTGLPRPEVSRRPCWSELARAQMSMKSTKTKKISVRQHKAFGAKPAWNPFDPEKKKSRTDRDESA